MAVVSASTASFLAVPVVAGVAQAALSPVALAVVVVVALLETKL